MSGLKEKLQLEMRKQLLEYGSNPISYRDYAELLFLCMKRAEYAEGTINNYRHINDKHIYPYIEEDVLTDIPSTKLLSIHNGMYVENLTFYYRTIARTILNHVFSFAYSMNRINENPCELVKIRE